MNIKGKTVIITGATSGIGRATAEMFAQNGAILILPVRDFIHGKNLREELLVRAPGSNIVIFQCDFSSFQSVRNLTKEIHAKYDHINILINNAGVFPQERAVSVDGHELNLAVNYLAPVFLTRELLGLLKKGVPSRVVNVASSMCREGVIDFEDFEGKIFGRYKAYAQSKLAVVLFTKTLAHELKGTGVTVNALHPGVIKTKLALKPLQHTSKILRSLFVMKMESPNDGAERIMHLVTSPEVTEVSGEYFEKNKIVRLPETLVNDAVAARLAEETKKILQLTE